MNPPPGPDHPVEKLPRLVRSALIATSLMIGVLAGCGTRSDACLIPADATEALALLQGRWIVFDYAHAPEGEIRFDGDRIETRWEENTLYGRWRAIDAGSDRSEIELWIDSADEGGARQTYGRFDVVRLTLVFDNADRLYALQSEGTWTSWNRVVEDASTEADQQPADDDSELGSGAAR